MFRDELGISWLSPKPALSPAEGTDSTQKEKPALVLEPRGADGTVAGSYRSPDSADEQAVHFSVTTDGTATFHLEGSPASETLIVQVPSGDSASVSWNGTTFDGMGALSSEEKTELSNLMESDLAHALSMVPLDLGCRSEEDIAPQQLAALLVPWQMQLKYLSGDRLAEAARLAEGSVCSYFANDASLVLSEANVNPESSVPKQLMLSNSAPIPVVFGYFPFDAEGSTEPAALQAPPSRLASLSTYAMFSDGDKTAVAGPLFVRNASVLPSVKPEAMEEAGTIRDEYGPCEAKCRGACGVDCTLTNCKYNQGYRCVVDENGKNTGKRGRFDIYDCGVHQGCIDHDACYDQCNSKYGCGSWRAAVCRHRPTLIPELQSDSALSCDSIAFKHHGRATSVGWALGHGPFEGNVIFEYTDKAYGEVTDLRLCPVPVAEDSDGDGVSDDVDRCPDTPQGTDVDELGCALDSDGDGVPDDEDSCPDTPQGTQVDEDGCPDSDGDGVSDDVDRCPDTPQGERVNEDGCSDSDGDGVSDDEDSCPDTPQGTQVNEDGCPDSDGDGVSDDVDQCPDTPQGTEVDELGCALDSDGDGVSDDVDRCPDTPKGTQVNEDGCPDSDGDGVPDDEDLCPDTPKGTRVNEDGCPDSDGDGVPDDEDLCPDTPQGTGVNEDGCPVGVIECVAISKGSSTEGFNDYTIKAIVEDVGQQGTDVTIELQGHGMISGSSSKHLGGAGELTWGLTLPVDEKNVTVMVRRLDTGASCSILIPNIPLELSGRYAGSLAFEQVVFNSEALPFVDGDEDGFNDLDPAECEAQARQLQGQTRDIVWDFQPETSTSGTALLYGEDEESGELEPVDEVSFSYDIQGTRVVIQSTTGPAEMRIGEGEQSTSVPPELLGWEIRFEGELSTLALSEGEGSDQGMEIRGTFVYSINVADGRELLRISGPWSVSQPKAE